MGLSIHIWSDEPRSDRRNGARRANDKSAISVQVTSNLALLGCFREWNHVRKLQCDSMDFHTHGSPGAPTLGIDAFNEAAIEKLSNQGFENMFAANASITFNGCSVADQAVGEYFLVKIANTFLSAKGGTAIGNTGLGLADPLFSGSVYHPFGSWVIARAGPGGTVSLAGHTHLKPTAVQRRINEAQALREAWDIRKSSVESMNNAASHLKGGSYWNLFMAHLWLDKVEKELSDEIAFKRARSS